jgi:hypothetical protein
MPTKIPRGNIEKGINVGLFCVIFYRELVTVNPLIFPSMEE